MDVSLAYYPVSRVPLSRIALEAEFPALRVRALQGGRLVELVEGWPIDYSEEKVAFLQRDGKELVINRDSIWSLQVIRQEHGVAGALAAPDDVEYAHPQASGFCVRQAERAGLRPIFPQQFLNDEVVIKRELDRLQEGYEKVDKYSQDQIFYPVPEVYRNVTSLGLWLSTGSRHGASDRRNNMTPLLVDELSLGPFGYQHVIRTGSAPNRLLIHEEPQTQLFYAFKSAYFHASLFFDPNVVLVGSKYDWAAEDFHGVGASDRWVEAFLIELGLDLGWFSMQLVPVSVGEIGVGGSGKHTEVDANLWRVGPRIATRTFQADVTAGFFTGNSGGMGQHKLRYARANLDVLLASGVTLGWTTIVRSVASDGDVYFVAERQGVDGFDHYDGRTLVNAFHVHWLLGHRAAIEGQLSVENFHGRFDRDASSDTQRNHVKAGFCGSFRF